MDCFYEIIYRGYSGKVIEQFLGQDEYIVVIQNTDINILKHEILVSGNRQDVTDFVDEIVRRIGNDTYTMEIVKYVKELNDDLRLDIDVESYSTIFDGKIVSQVEFNEDWDIELRTRETDEFITNLNIPYDIVLKLVERGFEEVLRDQIGREPEQVKIKQVIFNDPATIVFFQDGDKVVVKAGKGDEFHPEFGLAMACVKKMFGSYTAYREFLKQWEPQDDDEEDKDIFICGTDLDDMNQVELFDDMMKYMGYEKEVETMERPDLTYDSK